MSRRSQKRLPTPAAQPTTVPEAAPVRPGGDQVEIRINGVRVEVPPELEAAVRRACNGSPPPVPREMTTTKAAEFLDVSRPFVVKLLKRGELPCRLVGKHRRIPGAALIAYRAKMFQQAKRAGNAMAQKGQELGLYDLEGPSPKAP